MGNAIPKIVKSTFQLKRGISTDWASKDPILLEGEPGFELDTGKLKIGDGASQWSQLDYISSEGNGSLGDTQIISKIFSAYIKEDDWNEEMDVIIQGEISYRTGQDVSINLYNSMPITGEYYFNSLDTPLVCTDLNQEKIIELNGEEPPEGTFMRFFCYNFNTNTFQKDTEDEPYYILTLTGCETDEEIYITFITDLPPSEAPQTWSILILNPLNLYLDNTLSIKTINHNTPDENGNINVVQSVNNYYPDEYGNIYMPMSDKGYQPPAVTSEDNGKVLGVVNGQWDKMSIGSESGSSDIGTIKIYDQKGAYSIEGCDFEEFKSAYESIAQLGGAASLPDILLFRTDGNGTITLYRLAQIDTVNDNVAVVHLVANDGYVAQSERGAEVAFNSSGVTGISYRGG